MVTLGIIVAGAVRVTASATVTWPRMAEARQREVVIEIKMENIKNFKN
jgi:hypothetical protein